MTDSYVNGILDELENVIKSYETFSDIILEHHEDIYMVANTGDFPKGNTVLTGTIMKNLKTPIDNINILRGYLMATASRE